MSTSEPYIEQQFFSRCQEIQRKCNADFEHPFLPAFASQSACVLLPVSWLLSLLPNWWERAHAGEAQSLVEEKLADAKGGVLFIDEAYELESDYGMQAAKKLENELTKEEYANKTVIIVAGYRLPMHQMLARNSGLRHRFAREIEFPDWSAQDCKDYCGTQAGRDGFTGENVAYICGGRITASGTDSSLFTSHARFFTIFLYF